MHKFRRTSQTRERTALRHCDSRAVIMISATMAVAASAMAEAADTAADAQAADASPLQEVIVTAERREESLQKVPIAITVLSSEAIQRQNIADIHDLNKVAPSLSVNNAGSDRDSLNYVIRGMGVSSNSGSDPAVLVYFADVPTVTEGPGAIFDLENIQILKGPQGTLFGKNTTGGAILLSPARPGATFGGYLDATGGDYGLARLQGAVDVPLVADKLLARFAFDVNHRDGFTHNVTTGEDYDNVNYQSYRLSVTFKPFAGLEDRLILDHTHNDTHGAGLIIETLNPASGAALKYGAALAALFAAQQARGPRYVDYVSPTYNKFQTYNLTNTLLFEPTDNITLKNIFGYRAFRDRVAQDVVGRIPVVLIPPSPFLDTGTFAPMSSVALTDEQQIQGKAVDGRLNWILGAFYGDLKPAREDEQEWIVSQGTGPIVQILHHYDQTKAVFGQVNYALTDKWKVALGVRYTRDERQYNFGQYLGAPVTGARLVCTLKASITNPSCLFYSARSFHAPTANIDVNYQITPATMAYVTVRRGYRSGGFNPAPATTGNAAFEPEYDTDVEGGVKSDFTLGNMPARVNLSIYDNFFSDLQESSQVFDPVIKSPQGTTVNAGRGYIRGVELEATVFPIPDLKLTGFYAYLDPVYTQNSFQAGAPGTPPIDLRHQPFQNAPRNKAGLRAEYTLTLPHAAGDIVLSGNYVYQSQVYFNEPLVAVLPNPVKGQSGYSLTDARLDWLNVFDHPLDAYLFVTNLGNKLYKVQENDAYTSTGFGQALYGAPRMFGGGLKYRF
jgi:iron complex outermembrane recepter protein